MNSKRRKDTVTVDKSKRQLFFTLTIHIQILHMSKVLKMDGTSNRIEYLPHKQVPEYAPQQYNTTKQNKIKCWKCLQLLWSGTGRLISDLHFSLLSSKSNPAVSFYFIVDHLLQSLSPHIPISSGSHYLPFKLPYPIHCFSEATNSIRQSQRIINKSQKIKRGDTHHYHHHHHYHHNNKMIGIKKQCSLISLKINGPNSLVKRHRLTE